MSDFALYNLATRAKKICIGLAVIVAASAFVTSARANEDELEIKCRSMLQRQVFNCRLRHRVSRAALQCRAGGHSPRLWVLAVNDEGFNCELTVLYTRYGQRTIDATIMRFTCAAGSAAPVLRARRRAGHRGLARPRTPWPLESTIPPPPFPRERSEWWGGVGGGGQSSALYAPPPRGARHTLKAPA